MKNCYLLIVAFLFAFTAKAQVQIDKHIQLTGGTANDKRITGIATMADTSDAVNANTVMTGRLTYAPTTSIGNAYSLALPLSSGAYTAGMIVSFRANTANTGDVTLDINGLGAIHVYKYVNQQLASNDIMVGQVVSIIYDGTNFQVLSPLASASSFTGSLAGEVTGTQNATVIENNTISTTKLVDGSVTSVKIATGAITDNNVSPTAGIAYSKIAGTPTTLPPSGAAGGDLAGTYPSPTLGADVVTTSKILDGTIVDADISATAGIAYSKLSGAPSSLPPGGTAGGDLTGTFPNPTITTGAVTSTKILDGTIVNADISATAAIAYSKITGGPTSLPPSGAAGGDLTGTFPNPTITTDAVISSKILDGTIVNADISATAAIAYSKITGGPTSLPPSGAAGGDLTGTFPNPTITADAVTSSKIANGTIVDADISATAAIAYSKITGGPTSLPPSGAAGGDLTGTFPNPTVAANAVTSSKISDGTIVDADISATAAIAYSKITGVPTSLPPSGAAGGDLTGTFPNPVVAANAVTSAKVLDGTLVNADVSPTAAIAYSKLNLTNTIVDADISASAGIAYSKITGGPTSLPPTGAAGGDLTGTFPNPVVANNAVTSSKILDGTIANADVSAAAAISYSKLNLTGSLQGSDIAAGTFTSTNSHRALGNNDNVAREMRMLEPSGSGVNYTAFKAQAQASDITYTLPNTAPTAANQVLQVQAVAGSNAILSWGSVGAGSVLYNRVGVIANAGNTSYNVQVADDITGVDMSAGTNFTVNLPPATTAGKIYIIKIERYNNALLPVLTIQPNGTDKIELANNLAFGNAGGNRRLYCDGAGNWFTW